MRYVIKNGSSSVHKSSPRTDVFTNIAKESSELVKSGNEVAHVSSGAIAFGVAELEADAQKSFSVPEDQAFAAVGQIPLMEYWAKAYAKFDLKTGQVLVTNEVLASKLNEQKSHLSDTFNMLFKMGIVPVINENDAVAIAEIVQGDNDKLSALIANMIEAEVLILLGDIDSVFLDFPTNSQRLKNASLDDIDELNKICVDTDDSRGTGGMRTKIEAAKIFLSSSNVANRKRVYIAKADSENVIKRLEKGDIGTRLTLHEV